MRTYTTYLKSFSDQLHDEVEHREDKNTIIALCFIAGSFAGVVYSIYYEANPVDIICCVEGIATGVMTLGVMLYTS